VTVEQIWGGGIILTYSLYLVKSFTASFQFPYTIEKPEEGGANVSVAYVASRSSDSERRVFSLLTEEDREEEATFAVRGFNVSESEEVSPGRYSVA